MSRKGEYGQTGGQYGKAFSVAVVGLSGTEKEKGCLGVGKSCLCNRFVRPQADEYNRDHISVLSQTDFSGPIVNNEHWLYWGETRKATEEGFELTFSVIEQTEFVDDACFQPFRSGKMEPYYKRVAATKLSSAEKLMYVCKNQLGVEKEYEQHYLLDGRFNVDGFVCVFDVSEIQGREIGRQIELTAHILGTLLKTKKPVILATTKNDEVYPPYMREAEKLVNRREFKGLIPLVETSAHDNVNVDLAFWACVQRDWAKGKSKIFSFQDSFQRQRDRLEMVNENYMSLIRSQITDYRTHWNNTYSNLSQSHDFLMYCDLFGQESAQQTFKRHVKKLRDDYVCRKMQMYLRILPKVLCQLLPDLDAFGPDQSWPAVQQALASHPLFDSHFVINEGLSWQEVSDDSSETRIPFDLLSTAEAEKTFVDHRETLRGEEHLRSLRHQFSELLRETAIVPGQPLKDIRLILSGRECVETLPETELLLIYDDYQRLLQERAREQLLELFLERAPLFLQYCTGNMVTQEDLGAISEKLMEDERWSVLDLLPQDRDLALIRHLGFIQWPIKEHCPSFHACVDINTEAFCSLLAKRSRHPLWNSEPEAIRVKLNVLGTMGLSDNLANVVKAMRATLEQENPRVLLDITVSPESGGVGVLESRLYPNSVEPEAYVCVYSNRSSLEFVRKSLEQSLLTDLQFGNPHHATPTSLGLPLVLLLATSPETSAKERSYLREEGQNRAANLQCAFFDVTSDEPHARFKSDELLRALLFLTDSVMRRSDLMHVYSPAASSLSSLIPEGALNPEIRILVSLMCADPISPAHFLELLLLPHSLPNTTLIPVSKHSIVTDVGFLLAIDEDNEDAQIDVSQVSSRYVEFVVSSYHGAYTYKEELLHGHIMVYWSKRRASFANMSALASTVGPITPIQILALVENESRPSKLSHQLVADGQGLAQSLNANFRVSTLSHHMGRCISSFMNYALQNKLQIEKAFQLSATSAGSSSGLPAAQASPNSVLSNSNEDCYDPSIDPHFSPMMVSPRQLHRSRQADPSEPLSDSLYEHLPNEQAAAEAMKSSSGSAYTHGLPSSLVRQPKGGRSKHGGHHFGASATGLLEPADDAVHPETSPFFTAGYEPGSHEERLVKPSQIKQRRNRANSGDHPLMSADRYAVSSAGWAYHQTAKNGNGNGNGGAGPRQQLTEQWPPPQHMLDEDGNALEMYKAPGKLDLKRFNNLSDAIGRLTLNSPGLPLGPTRAGATSSFDGSDYTSNQGDYSPEQMLVNTIAHPRRGGGGGRFKGKNQFVFSGKEVDSDSETSDPTTNPTEKPPSALHPNAFNSLKPSSMVGSGLATAGHAKKLAAKNRGRVVPMPVAPPRLPSSANNSTAVTPTTASAGKLFLTTSSFDDSSQQDRLTSEASDATTAGGTSTGNLDDCSFEDAKSLGLDLEQSQLGETRRNRRQISKLFSLQSETDSGIGFLHDISSIVSGGVAALEDAFGKESGDADKKQVLKSKSVGTFAELDGAGGKKASRKAEKLEKKRQKEEERKSRKASKEAAGARNRSRSKSTTTGNHSTPSTASALEAFAQLNGNAVPLFIEKCTQFIELEGIDMEGIYRVPGNRAHVDTLLQQFDENPDINITDLDIPVNAVATALKDFFMKRLPPIFPADCMEEIASLSRQYTDTGVLADMRSFLHHLPNANYQIIHFMITHFAKVVEKSAINSMDSKNLAICWWPTLLQFEFSDMFVFEQMRPHLMNFAQIMIDFAGELFDAPNPTINLNSSEELTNVSYSADELVSL